MIHLKITVRDFNIQHFLSLGLHVSTPSSARKIMNAVNEWPHILYTHFDMRMNE